ncbi:MAG: RDD family protein [Candidatus Dormibacteraeota bacterium]|nr:RDD family protein [Candidatus Dormibacteraeota bacterium]MBO0703723.1 RDD family protein [Candidatus Dormibacteraeota bacterium]MBO0760417.1 RDD family protein [Candidatus Dormibacteraeota bacterium]
MSTQWTNPPYEPSAGSQLGAGELAGFWRRLVALILDLIVLWIIGVIVGAILHPVFGGTFNMTGGGIYYSTGSTNWINLIQFLIFLAYFGALWSYRGQSLGDMALGLRVVRTDGSQIGFGRGVARALALWLSFAIIIIPAIISAFTVGLGSRKQALHDMVVDTQVVRT